MAVMKKRTTKDYGSAVLLYPGMSLRAGSMMQIIEPNVQLKKEDVDKFVDKQLLPLTTSKNMHSRALCSKNRH